MSDPTSQFAHLLSAWPEAGEAISTSFASDLLELAEALLSDPDQSGVEPEQWHNYLDLTRRTEYLQALPDRAALLRWAETTFTVAEISGYDLLTMMSQRVQSHPELIFFRELAYGGDSRWSYQQVMRRVQAVAAVFLGEDICEPRVAILAENSIASACTDLACLFYDIFVTPLNIHFNADTIAWICDRVNIDTIVTDSQERLMRLQEVRDQIQRPLRIFLIRNEADPHGPTCLMLDEDCARLTPAVIQERLAQRPRFNLHDVCTTMFTSGSTGQPKGVAFTGYNLVTKRFARGAALPKVGQDEVLLCYLPLFHTFGRYLEMLGTIYWGGTYVFSGNPSAETLLAQFRLVRPTCLISIPLRWMQIRDHCLEQFSQEDSPERRSVIFRQVVGENLRWGLSAAGFLDPKVFRFYHRHGVDLCSGFGMTEATGGITMTPPGEYRENSVGIPLPGVQTRFSEQGELQISGHYVARYLADIPNTTDTDYWLATGDLFRVSEDGHYEIVDRIKDIYKNNKGQTIAPRKVEQKFTEVPGIERTFLAGDGRAYNTLLIVPDPDDPVLQAIPTEAEVHDYFHQIVSTANNDLAAYERVVNFAILDRDFSLEEKELTPKGSFRRKVIEENFQDVIQELYQSNVLILNIDSLRIQIPRWFFRDLGILETDIEVHADGLFNRQSQQLLTLHRDATTGRVRLGNLEYQLKSDLLDLGLFSRQPLLWAANPALTTFCPCKVGWDTPMGNVSAQVFLPHRKTRSVPTSDHPPITQQNLAAVIQLCQQALYGDLEPALAAVRKLERRLGEVNDRLANLIRRRLEALANHPDTAVRCLAYSILVLEEPVLDYNEYLPAFLESGRTFLNEESIKTIASTNVEPRRLQAFRKRLHTYRTQLPWPASAPTRRVFDDLFHLLSDFARYHPEYYAPVREELVSWVLHEEDPELSQRAERYFHELAEWYESRLTSGARDTDRAAWAGKIIYQEGLTQTEIDRLQEVFIGTTFLKESVMLAFDGESFNIQEIEPGGIWISRILTWYEYSRYRVSINSATGKHFDLQLIIREDLNQSWVLKTIFWLIAIHGYPHSPPVLPRFGCCRPELGAISLAYTSDLTVWEKIREFSSVRGPGTSLPTRAAWRKLFVLAMSTVFAGWLNSGRRIVPGTVNPTNVVVPEPDFREGHHITSLTGWRPYEDPLSLIRPLLHNFFLQSTSHFPWCKNYLEEEWIFEACTEALGVEDAREFLTDLSDVLQRESLPGARAEFAQTLDQFQQRLQDRYYLPMALRSAIERYGAWVRASHNSSAEARIQTCEELYRLYRLDRFPEIARYSQYRHTYFAKHSQDTLEIFDRLLTKMFRSPSRRAKEMVELSDLQATLTDPDDRTAFRRMAFPRAKPAQELEVLTIGDREKEQVIVRSQVTDRHGDDYTVFEPTSPAEVGQVYRLFLLAGFPKTISERDRFFVLTDSQEQISGGICYQVIDDTVVHLDGIVVTRALLERGLTSALLEDFCSRMADLGFRAVKTHFFLRGFYQRRGFNTDNRWGGLVRFLSD